MKAARYTSYDPPEVVQIVDVEKPLYKDDEVLIKVRAASVNLYDWHFMRGDPYPARIPAGGLRRPKDTRLGAEVAGCFRLKSQERGQDAAQRNSSRGRD